MKKFYLSLGLLLALGLPALAQNQKTASNDAPKAKKVRANSDSSSKNDVAAGSLLEAGTSLEAQLQSMLDVKKSKVGDEVVLKTTKTIKQNGEVIVPKGTQLIGRVTEVQQRTKDNAVSKVGIIFDRIHGKELDAPFSASIVSLVAAKANAAAGDVLSADLSGSGSGSASASRGSGGGLLGGGGGLLGGVGSTVNSTLGTATNTVGSVSNAAVGTVRQTTGTVGRTVSGVQISQSASGSASSASTLSATGKDLRIEKGATFNLKVDSSARSQE